MSQFMVSGEFKLDGTADEALQQIEDKGYARPYEADERKLYRIGVSFSSETGTVSDWKVVEWCELVCWNDIKGEKLH